MKSLIVVCGIIQNTAGKVLLVQRSASMQHPLMWEFPGGKVQHNESMEAAVIRELQEELAIRVNVGRIGNAVTFSYPKKSVELQPVFCQLLSANITLKEHSALRWLSPDELLLQPNLLQADVALLKANSF